MIKLNDSNVFIGHIKQLLKNFNLPNCPIGESNKEPNKHFIENDKIYLYKYEKDSFGNPTLDQNIFIDNYIFNSFYINLTSNLKLDNNIYDRYTHRYLGKYLRFIRDYKNVDLMSMYNCFDQEVFEKEFNFKINDIIKKETIKKEFISDENITVYSIPVYLNKLYLFKMISTSPIEGCLYIDNENLKDDAEKLNIIQQIAEKTFFKKVFYNQPVLIDLFKNLNVDKDNDFLKLIKENNQNLRLLLKVPSSLKSSITILEKDNTFELTNLNINPQLFDYTNDNNYLLADKLIEYLTGNAICPLSQDYDIEKVQRCLNNIPWIQGNSSEQQYYGKWSNYDSGRILYFIWVKNLKSKYFDLLGYCDKDIEKELNITISQLENIENTTIGGII